MNIKSTFISAWILLTLFAVGLWFASDVDIYGKRETTIKSLTAAALSDAQFSNRRVIYIDTREKEEFDEGHIPGAWNIPLRKVSQLTKQQMDLLRNADIVVPYCIKDFRGYEVARELQRLGISQVKLIDGFGLTAWKKNGGVISL